MEKYGGTKTMEKMLTEGKVLVSEDKKTEKYFNTLDAYIGQNIKGGKLGKWQGEYQPRDLASFVWYYDDTNWAIYSSINADNYPKTSAEMIFEVMNDMEDVIVSKKYRFESINIKTDYNLYMKYLKEIMKLAEKKIK
jgi:hypothetical protein